MVNLQKFLESFGNRGYRISQLDAEITGGKMYLAAYAQYWSHRPSFYDDMVTDFFPTCKKQGDHPVRLAQ